MAIVWPCLLTNATAFFPDVSMAFLVYAVQGRTMGTDMETRLGGTVRSKSKKSVGSSLMAWTMDGIGAGAGAGAGARYGGER
jgi:hypothetical protein